MTQMHQAAELEMVTPSYHSCVPNTPKFAALPAVGFYFFNFNSGLSKYYKPVHPSPLAFILLLLEFFLFGIALSFGGGFLWFLINDPLLNEWHDHWLAHTSTQIPLGQIILQQ